MDGSRTQTNQRLRRILLALSLCLAILPAFGCIGMTAQLVHTLVGNKVKAEFTGLEDQRVAVIGYSGNSVYEQQATMETITTQLRINLKQVPKIDLVKESKVYNWFDTNLENNPFAPRNFYDLGKGTDAGKVLALRIDSFSINDDATLLKGRCSYELTVYDIDDDGEKSFFKTGDFSWPQSHGRPAIGTNPNSFKAKFIEELVRHLGKQFYSYELHSDFGRDAMDITE